MSSTGLCGEDRLIDKKYLVTVFMDLKSSNLFFNKAW